MSVRPALLCYDGSAGSARAIARAGELLQGGAAVVVSGWEREDGFAAHDPGAVISGLAGRLTGLLEELDEIAAEQAVRQAEEGARLAKAAGFDAEARALAGRPWRTIVSVAEDLDAAVIVLGASGRTAVGSAVLGSVAARVVHHTRRDVLIAGALAAQVSISPRSIA